MYCYRCGNQIPTGGSACPACDSPARRKQKRNRRFFAGLVIFLAGAFAGSFVDSILFSGKSVDRFWKHLMVRTGQFFSAPDVGSSTSEIPENIQPERLKSISEDTRVTVSSMALNPLSRPEKPDSPEQAATESTVGAFIATTAADLSSFTAGIATNPLEHAAIASSSSATGSALMAPDPVVPPEMASPATQTNQITYDYASATLLFDRLEPLVKNEASNFHGSADSGLRKIIFSSSIDGAKYQCMTATFKPPYAAGKVFEWPGNVYTPSIAPYTGDIVYSSDSEPGEHIFLWSPQTASTSKLTNGNSKNMMPSWSPDGSCIAFTSGRKGNNDIWLMASDGVIISRLTKSSEDEREPCWTPDGRAVVFTRIHEKLKRSSILKVIIDPFDPEVEPEVLVDGNCRNWMPSVSPDGVRIAFSRSLKTDGSGNVIVVKNLIDGTEMNLEPIKESEHYRPVWTSDSAGIIFHSESKGRKSIYRAIFRRE